MAVNENDLELLESYLDDEISAEQQDVLRSRLSSEPELASAMDELRSARDMRGQYFATCEPDEQSVQRLIKSVNKSITRDIVWSRRSRVLRGVGSLAACLLVGFMGGYGIRGWNRMTSDSNPQKPIVGQVVGYNVENSQPPGPISIPPSNFGSISSGGGVRNQPSFQINIIDEHGRVIGAERFKSAEDARQFQASLSKWLNEHKQSDTGIKVDPGN
jgi:anti-sigma factor RsiW